MCRLAAFPPRFDRDRALEILLEMEGHNTDGIGSAYLKNGKFVVEKYPTSLSEIIRGKIPFLSHMPYSNSWTIAHLRAASHGDVAVRNTHPFVVGNWCIVHNGVWSEYNVVKLALEKASNVKFQGETDTEVACHLFNAAGPKRFMEEVDRGGVFVALNRNGQLHVVKTSGDLKLYELKKKRILLASELPWKDYSGRQDGDAGWYLFDAQGRFIKNEEKPTYSYQDYSFVNRTVGNSSSKSNSSSCAGSSCSLPVKAYTGNQQKNLNLSETSKKDSVPARPLSFYHQHWED